MKIVELAEIEIVHQYNIDFKNREIFISGEECMSKSDEGEPGVDHVLSARLIKNLRLLGNYNNNPILIHMKTCGGDWNEGMAVYDAIKNCPAYITILNYTHARSMSSMILQAADNRVMMPHSEFMFHHGTYGDDGEFITVISAIDFYKKTTDAMYNIYIESMRSTKGSKWFSMSKGKIKKWLAEQMEKKNDVYLTATEAVQNGFADSVFTGDWNSLFIGA